MANRPINCPDCGVSPGEIHLDHCDVERCSCCGDQKMSCYCHPHDKAFARWTGFWPGSLEAESLGLTLNDIYIEKYHKLFFVKPQMQSLQAFGFLLSFSF